MPDVPRERFIRDVQWPAPARDPDHEPVDSHRPPLDDERDVGWLDEDDPRRIEIERRER
jgi:hypothetical protein